MSLLKPTLANQDLLSKKIPYILLLMKRRSCLMLVHGTTMIELDGSVFSLSTESMDIILSSLHRMTECWTDRSEALSNMRTFIGESVTSVGSVGLLKGLRIGKFSQASDAGTRSRKERVFICLLPIRNIIAYMTLALFLIAVGIMV